RAARPVQLRGAPSGPRANTAPATPGSAHRTVARALDRRACAAPHRSGTRTSRCGLGRPLLPPGRTTHRRARVRAPRNTAGLRPARLLRRIACECAREGLRETWSHRLEPAR